MLRSLIIILSISPLEFADNEVKTPPAQVIEIDIKGMVCRLFAKTA